MRVFFVSGQSALCGLTALFFVALFCKRAKTLLINPDRQLRN